jgi:hypothetical protein
MSKESRKDDKMVVVQGGLVRRFNAVAYAASLAIMHACVRRLENRLIHLFLVQLLLFPSGCVVIEDSCGGVVENYRFACIIGSLIKYVSTIAGKHAFLTC